MEDLIMRLTYMGFETQITPKYGMLELVLTDSTGKFVTKQVAETYEDLFAKTIVKLAADSISYRELMISKKGLSVL